MSVNQGGYFVPLLYLIFHRRVIDARSKNRYDENASGRLDGRGSALRRRVEESPHSTEHGAGETPGRGNLPDRATETDSPLDCRFGIDDCGLVRQSKIENLQSKIGRVMVKRRCKRPPASAAMRAARQPPPGARPNRDETLLASLESRVGCTER